MMKSITTKLLTALAVASLSTCAYAGGKGGGRAGAGAVPGAGGTHMSPSGQANTNSPYAEERRFGQDRAADRRSEQGAAHEQGSIAPANRPEPKGVLGSPNTVSTPPAKSATEK